MAEKVYYKNILRNGILRRKYIIKKNGSSLPFERVEKVDTLLDGNAARSKIKDFRTALYPRQYHPSALEKPLIQRFFAYKVFFRRACQRKNRKCSITDERVDFEVYRQTGRNAKDAFRFLFCCVSEIYRYIGT